MKKILNYLLFAAVVISMSSCFETTEELTINEDGSGVYVNIMDATKFAEQLQILTALDTTGEMAPKMKYTLDSSFVETLKKYARADGVTNVTADTSKPNIYKVSINFANVDALNEAINQDMTDNNKNIYEWKKGQFSRKDGALTNGMVDMNDESQKDIMKSMLEGMKYTIIMKFPGKIKSSSNKEAKISDNKNSVTLSCSLLDVMNKKVSLGNEVKYK